MPIAQHLRHFYRGPAWKATRERILERDGNCCAQCGKPNGETIQTVSWKGFDGRPVMLWRATGSPWWVWFNGRRNRLADMDKFFEGTAWRRDVRSIHNVISVCHLNHVSGDDRDENLKSLCSWCHLNWDALHHRETRARNKDRSRPLLEAAR